MALVGEAELSMFLNSHHNAQQHNHLMDWTGGQEHGGHGRNARMHHQQQQGGDLSSSASYIAALDPFQSHHFSLSNLPPQTPFDLGDGYPTAKVEPMNNSDFDLYNPASQVNTSQGSYHVGGSSFMSQQAAHSYGSQSAVQHQHQHQQGVSGSGGGGGGNGNGGALEEIDGLLRNFSDGPQQQHHELDMEQVLFSDLMSFQQHQPQHQTSQPHSPYATVLGPGGGPVQLGLGGGHASGLGGVSQHQQQHGNNHWGVDARAVLLARDLHEQIMSENSLDTSHSLGSENSSATFGSASDAAMSNFYSEVARGHAGMSSSNWGDSGSLKGSTSSHHQQHSKVRMNPSPLGGGYSQPHPNFFHRSPVVSPAGGFMPSSSSSPSSLHQLPISKLPSNAHHHLHQLTEQILPGTIVPASGLQLVHLLLACAEAVAENRLGEAEVILARLRSHVLPDGNPMQRLAAYFEQALTARLTKENSSPIFKGLTGDRSIPQAEILEAFSVYYECIPIGKFGHLTCNQILLDAVEREKVVHVLDLHIWHGMQWPAFLQALAYRPGGPPKLRMSAVGSDLSDLQETGEKLLECAKTLSVPFEFCPILTPLEDFTANMVETRRNEALVVNSFVQFHGVLNKGPDSLNLLLGDLRRLNPKVMAFAENDGNHNSTSFLTRFVECLRYYSAVFDAFDASLPPDSTSRMKMEQIFAAQKIRNIIACEGPARVDGHETMKFWHKRMELSHFRCVPLSNRAVSQANLLLNLYYSNGYTLNTSDCGYLTLGWHGMPLTGVSAWQ